ncbi:pleiotropic regulatory protein RsmS [Vibrio sp. SCSIO 43136]|uniref:pleiotropic regulatory protein RsmS n=1 Tax=Vibrio sp. SCSIO 43136 TaxID=2819101 RepID=UPI002074E025|nr:pleiotropic regulatory protein RsmS [Vibrio sp. SCSIO 43136]USD64363.1 pleiotropic regulatory protein RsmS [Vibrio sp. SCSIO 43136]
MSDQQPQGLEHAPDDIKLAVDLIYLLEENNVDPKTALRAIEMVKQDLLRKVETDTDGIC